MEQQGVTHTKEREMKKSEWFEKEKALTDELITDILFHKEEIGEDTLLKRALNLVTNHLELVSYCIDKEEIWTT